MQKIQIRLTVATTISMILFNLSHPCCAQEIDDKPDRPRNKNTNIYAESNCPECQELSAEGCVPVKDSTPCLGGICCSGKCISLTDLCECGSNPKIKKIHLTKSSCGMSDDEVDLTKYVAENIITTLARKISQSANRTTAAARVITTIKFLVTIYAKFEYRCCINITPVCCVWDDRTRKTPLNGPVAGCFIFRHHSDFYDVVANSIRKEINNLCL